MPRPNRTSEKRRELLPIVARAFAERGYRRTTTGELARRCGVRENVLYRLWKDKRAMFIAAIDFVFENSQRIWRRMLASDDGRTPAERLLAYEAEHHGEFGLYRIVFAGLSETDDPQIRTALARMYRRFATLIGEQVAAHRAGRGGGPHPPAELAAWAVIGLGTMASICRETRLLPAAARSRLIAEAGRTLLVGIR